jgi:predicted dehydrogenase
MATPTEKPVRDDFERSLSRRGFLKTSAATAAGVSAGLMASRSYAYADGSDVLRVGLVGCGGRGTGAARDCVAAAPGVQLVAMGDLFANRLEQSRALLAEALGDAYRVTDDRCFTGFDNYRRVIESDIDLVLLAEPPGYRPIHFRAAVDAGKHVFMEKPAGVDVAGCHSIIESGEIAARKRLSVVAGTQYRRQPSYMEAIARIHEGRIGDLVAGQAHFLTGPIWVIDREAGMSDMEWQCRNWYYFTWLSGDFIVEQFVHNLDTMNWVFGGPPVRCVATGGRQQRVEERYGHIYDHFSVEYEYPNGARVAATCRQMANTSQGVLDRIVGTTGVAELLPASSRIIGHDGSQLFRQRERGNNPYVQEHADLIASIRAGTAVNEARELAESTLTGIMGREAAYTGQVITWEEILQVDMDLLPNSFEFGPAPFPAVAVPGQTSVSRRWADAG